MTRYTRLLLTYLICLMFSRTLLAQDLMPNFVVDSDLVVEVRYEGTMPALDGPILFPGTAGINLGSPVAIAKYLYLIDQNGDFYRTEIKRKKKPSQYMACADDDPNSLTKMFSAEDAPDGVLLDNRQSILNISPGRNKNSLYVAFTSGAEPQNSIPIYRMPSLPGDCCIFENPIPIDDLYRVGPIPEPLSFLGTTRTEYQVLYEYKLHNGKLAHPRAIAAFETQSGPTHNGGGMLTLPDGRILFATGDPLPFGVEGRFAPQDPDKHVCKLLIVDPQNGSVEVAAMGVRNVQHMEYVATKAGVGVSFADIGGSTAEEINFILLRSLLDTSEIENFGWGRNPDGYAREGTFYVGPGMALANTDIRNLPPVEAVAPYRETGFIQPLAQWGRHDPNGGFAASGPVVSRKSFTRISAFFGDLSTGRPYAVTAPLETIDAVVYRVTLVDEDGSSYESFNDIVGGRADPRFFRFPNGEAGVLLEATGKYYSLKEK